MIDSAEQAALAKLVNLASPRVGAQVIQASDEFFAPKERMIQDAPPIFYPGRFDENGKWMDGWETRRRRGLGHDWCIVKLGVPGYLKAIEVDTSHFTGNFPPGCSVEGRTSAPPPSADADWRVLVPASPLRGNDQQVFKVEDKAPVAWLRLSIFPDGGVARLRVYGTPFFDPAGITKATEIELSALRFGGRILGYSDAHYGAPWVILTEGRGATMGDGWETRRRREPGNDWIVIALGVPGEVTRIEIDTAHFKGNYPDMVSIDAYKMNAVPDDTIVSQSMFWPPLLPQQKLAADHIHVFDASQFAAAGPVTHVRVNMHPDGGLSRVRIFGHPV